MRKTFGWVMSVLLSVMLVAAPAFARTETYAAPHIQFDVPDNWVTTTQGNLLLTRAPQGGVAIEFQPAMTREEMQRAGNSLDQVLATRFQNVQVRNRLSNITQGGLTGAAMSGTATRDGQPVGWFAVFLAHQAGGVVAVGFVAQAQFQANQQTIAQVVNSIRAQ